MFFGLRGLELWLPWQHKAAIDLSLFQIQKILSGAVSEYQTVWIQTVFKGYQQTIKVAAYKERVEIRLF